MNIFLHELKMARRSWAYWTLSLVLTLLLFMLIFPPIAKDAALLQQVFAQFPPELVQAVGLDDYNLADVVSFYGFLFTYITLIGAVFAMRLGISALSEEIRVKTADFLISKPVTRTNIVSAKLAGVLAQLLGQNLVFVPTALVIARMVYDQPFNTGLFFTISLTLLLVQLFFAALGVLQSVVLHRIRTVLPLAMGTVFLLFVLQMLSDNMDFDKLKFFTPFAYFNPARIIRSGGLDLGFLALNLGLVAAFILTSYYLFQRKDMPSV